jgi:ethanolamine utilization protein EutN
MRSDAMLLGKVIGTLVACEVYEGLRGVPLLVVQPLTKSCVAQGEPIICADSTSMAGPGELVYYEGGREAAMALRESFVPVDHTIVGIVDDVHISTSGFPA